MKRIPKHYDGKEPTGRQLKDLLPEIMAQIAEKVDEDPMQIVRAWPELVGPQIAQMTKATRFDSGVLRVNVENSTLYSLLATHEKKRLLQKLQKRFPKVAFKNILFRIG